MSNFDSFMSGGDSTPQPEPQPEQSTEAGRVFLPIDHNPTGDTTDAPSSFPGTGGRMRSGSLGLNIAGPIVFLLIIALGGGAIYGMRTISNKPAVTTGDFSIDYTSMLAGQAFTNRFDSAMHGMTRSSRPVQVSAEHVARDPFGYPRSMLGIYEEDGEVDSLRQAELAERARMLRAEQQRQKREEEEQIIESALATVLLQGIVGGRVPLARVSGKTIRVGDQVGEIFTVSDIDRQFITIEALGRRFKIMIGQEPVELH